MPKITLFINGHKKELTTLTELEEVFKQNENIEYLEYNLSGHSETSVFVLINQKTALAVYFRYDGDSGFATTNREGNAGIYQTFMLSNGQIDEYSENMLVERSLSFDIIRHYFISGMLCEFVEWKEEG